VVPSAYPSDPQCSLPLISDQSSCVLTCLQNQDPRRDTIEVHNDDPVHFELMLKWLYTRQWDRDIEAQRGFFGESNPRSKAFVAVGVYAIGNKYSIPSLRERALLEVSMNSCLFDVWSRGRNDIVNLVIVHCTRCLWTDCEMCDLLFNAFVRGPEAEDVWNLDIVSWEYERLRWYLEWVEWCMTIEEWGTRIAAWLDANT
jgi:hypothetical protein